MSDNVLLFPGTIDLADTGPEDEGVGPSVSIAQLIEGTKEHNFSELIIIGQTDTGLYFASTSGNPSSILWDMERAKHILMESYFSGEDNE